MISFRPKLRRVAPLTALIVVCAAAALSGASCGGSGDTASTQGTGASSSNGTSNGGAGGSGANAGGSGGTVLTTTSTGGGMVHSIYQCPGCTAFPGLGAQECSPQTLGPPTLVYPSDGLLLPPNMNVLEVQFKPPSGIPASGDTLYEVDFENAVTDVRVETMCDSIYPVRDPMHQNPPVGCGVTLPQMAWNDISNVNRDGDPLKVTVRATTNGNCVSTSEQSIKINFAKEDIQGGIYYWQSTTYIDPQTMMQQAGQTGGIYSHDFGTFDPTPVPFYTADQANTCVGCHNVSRDGQRMSLAVDDADADDEFGDVRTAILNINDRSVIAGQNGAMSPGFQTWTHDHGLMIATTYKDDNDKGFDVFNGNTGAKVSMATPTLALPTGMLATHVDLSKDDTHLVFVVAPPDNADMNTTKISGRGDHHLLQGSIYWASFTPSPTAPALGTPTLLLQGDATHNYYYPSFSSDGKFLVLNEGTTNNDNGGDAFYNETARVKLLHFPGSQNATPIDLKNLNGTGRLANSWPKWSPFVQTYKGHKILWLTFSSNRDYGLRVQNQDDPSNPGHPYPICYPYESPSYDQCQVPSKSGQTFSGYQQPQIWMAAIVIDPDPALDSGDRSYPAFWLPFQDVTSHNHTAQWVESINQGGGGAGGGSGAGGGDGGPMCGGSGATCGNGHPSCCSNLVCCGTSCLPIGACVH
ncbi:MAG TPA: hypothetical protein VHB21_27020 [Minicystis sp.]|nr:hypothetical protein [Minicystis sp.]